MSITSFIRKVAVQTVVYWEFEGLDQFSSPQFADPVERKVRWDETSEVVSDSNGREFVSRAQLLIPDDMKEQSYVWLGELADLPANPDPLETQGAYEIKKMDRHPLFRSQTLDVFIAYL